MSISGRSGTLYAGSELTLICSIPLSSVLEDVFDDVVVTSRWFGPRGEELPPTENCEGARICVSEAELQFGSTYGSTVMFDTLRTSDSGNYNCTATVSIPTFSNVTDGWGTFVGMISVESKLF